MKEILIERIKSDKYGTKGVMSINGITICNTLELQWLENKRKESCIPEGSYEARPFKSSKHGEVYVLFGVPERGGILIHKGNFAGQHPLKSDSNGCILLGIGFGKLSEQPAILNSKSGMQKFMDVVNNENVQIIIKNPL